jgi:hypothetical protein
MYGSCRCTMRGRAWFIENGEESATEIWSIFDAPELFLDKWAASIDAKSCMEKFNYGEERAVAFRPCGEAEPISYHTIEREMVPQYNVHGADKANDAVASARHWRARDLVRDRKERRTRRAAKQEAGGP